MGFNGARKHQKVEDSRYYYWADKLGLLVWGELPSSYEFNTTAAGNSARELSEFVAQKYNHPSIIFWVPLNESWGVNKIVSNTQQQNYARSLYYTLKALDPTRLVSTNDGWEQVAESDICAIHDYALFPSNTTKYSDMERIVTHEAQTRKIYAQGCQYAGQPVLLTEYGGIAFASEGQSGGAELWGYFEAVQNEEEFFARLEPVTRYLFQSGKFQGFCYTQLTDVMQEVNGLLDIDRCCKVDIGRLRRLFSGRFK